MITRIKIDGFKSLLNTELFFGPFTCIAGANAIGKSNFFDAIQFLSKLADIEILEAAKSIRSEDHKHSNFKDIFYKSGLKYIDKMSFEIDMLISEYGEDDLGQNAKASITSVRYTLELRLNEENEQRVPIEIIKEELIPITLNKTRKSIFFNHHKDWMNSVVLGRRVSEFISTEGTKIKLHSNAKDENRGRTTHFLAEKMPRTLLSTVTAESPTAFLVRQEMRNWKLLQFEPSALREPNEIDKVRNSKVSENGKNLPATLYRLYKEYKDKDIYQTITNQLKDLVSNVKEIEIDRDDKRDLLTLRVRFKDGLIVPAQSLSDGTLRFLGLAVINEDSKNNGLICMEEPENGINPMKIKAIVDLVQDMATDTSIAVGDDNPLRQVIINTHSPIVVSSVPDDSLYLASETEIYSEHFGKKITYTQFSALKDTWKTIYLNTKETTLGEVKSYLENQNESYEDFSQKDQYEKIISQLKSKPNRSVKENYLIHQPSLFD